MKKKKKRKMGTRNIWDKEKTNSKITDSIISIIMFKGNGINISI